MRFLYDQNGNLTLDTDKSLSISYNFLNLPSQLGSLGILYDATGRKWRKAGPSSTTLYSNGIEYRDGKLEAIYLPDGRLAAEYAGSSITRYRAEYFHQDHLGNTRLAFSDFNQDQSISLHDDPATPDDELEITQEAHYYPFGMGHLGPWYESVNPENKHLYNGKELNDEEGVGLYDYGARWYDAALGRWGQVDPLAEPQASWSTYHYVYGNPMKYFDPFGLMGADGLTNQQWMKASRPGGSAGAARRYREDNRQAEAEQARFGKWFRENYEWNPHAGQEVGRATLGGALRLSFSGGYLLRQTASGQSFRFSEAPSPHAISVSAGAAWGGGIGFEVGKVYDGRGRSEWFFRADARIGFGGGASVNYEEITPAPGRIFRIDNWEDYDNYWGIGIGPFTYGEGRDQVAWGRDGDSWFNPNVATGHVFTYRGGSIQPPDLRRSRRSGPVQRSPKAWGMAFEAYKSWGKTTFLFQ